jgi:DNA repair exonuclease SbcCD nuclease subunit
MGVARILFLADTHLGFDLPFRPRVVRRRRGPDFFANFERALQPALDGEVDAVVHGGDLLYRSRVPPKLVQMAMEPLRRVADAGVPVLLVPGNHERSSIPHALLAVHPLIYIFRRPETFSLRCGDVDVAFAGFPYYRASVRQNFRELVARADAGGAVADIKVLCMHHCVEGATVGPVGYTFRSADDVVRGADVPAGFAAALSGHIHRSQVLTRDLRGRTLAAPVLYPGSIERTSFAERDEAKGYLLLELTAGGTPGGRLAGWRFQELPSRPMLVADLRPRGADRAEIEAQMLAVIQRAPPDAILRFTVHGELTGGAGEAVSAANLRSLAPPTMNVSVRYAGERNAWTRQRDRHENSNPREYAE